MSGEPSYIELGVPDADRARAFYSAVLGWQASGATGSGQVDTATLDVGIHDGDAAAHFEVFFLVDDLEAALGEATVRGGTIIGDVHDEPGFGRWVECADDQGVRFGLRQAGAA